MGAFFYFFEKTIFIGSSSFFLEHRALPNGGTSLDPQLQNRNKCIPLYSPPFQFIYMRVELWANHMDKPELLLGTSWGMYLGTL
jgi:hypothetical protein